MKVMFSQTVQFPGTGAHILVLANKTSHDQFARVMGVLCPNAVDILSWLHIIASKPPLVVPNYLHAGIVCTMFIFDFTRADYKLVLRAMGEANKESLKNALALASDEQLVAFFMTL